MIAQPAFHTKLVGTKYLNVITYNDSMRKKYTSISIPVEMHKEIEKLIKNTNFVSVSDFIKHLLRDIIASGDISRESRLTPREVELVRRRLRSLGYI
jgi:Arc/MetJ-type ribon-helix-helix transcriptional regulator